MNNLYLKSLLILIVVSLWGTVSPGQNIGFDIVDNKNSIEIPFESHNNLIVIPVILNHRMPLRFVVDTGVRTSILTDRTFSDILNISYDRKIPLVGADGDRQIVAYVANGISLKLPGVVGQGQALLVLEEDYLQLKNYLGTDVHGILGYELFSRFVVEIDYDDRLLRLHEPYSYKPRKSHRSLPLTVVDTKPYVHTNITLMDGTVIASKFMLDTGASHSLLLDLESHPDLHLPDKILRTNLGRGLGGAIYGHLGRLQSVEFGKYHFTEVIASWPDVGSFAEILKKTGRQGTLGGGLLSRFTVVFDYFNGYLYYKRNRNFRNKFEYNMSGMDLKVTGQKLNHYEIHEIREGSPASRTDLQVGDEIFTINGHPARELTLGEVNNFFRLREGKKINLTVLRNDQKLRRTFWLERVL
ncbi:MAG: aspartyl protease family protein [Cyclobacteriaceae bacterium]|nr:aspartyl protease family protein [Cyclobacteriaceae bacterium]